MISRVSKRQNSVGGIVKITIRYLERASVGITQLTHNPEIVIKLDECRLCKLHEKHIDLLQKEVTMLRDELKRIAYREGDK